MAGVRERVLRSYVDLTEEQRHVMDAVEAALRQRMARMGDEPSGLSLYYRSRFDAGRLLADRDLAVVELVRAQRGRFSRIWDIGCGAGQVAAALAVEGFEVVAVERDPRRLGALEETLEVLRRESPQSAARIRIVNGLFPEIATDSSSDDLALVICVAWKMTEDAKQAFTLRLRQFKMALIEFAALFSVAEDDLETQARIEAYISGGARQTASADFRYWHNNASGVLSLMEHNCR